MAKIALVTCYFQHNYGSQLQALATEMAMDKLGKEYETIRIDGLKAEINHTKYLYFLSKIFDWQTVKDKMATVRKVIAKRTRGEYAANLALRDGLFSRFSEQSFHLSRRYNSKVELGRESSKYSDFIVGSDQLWLPSNIAADYYTLNFVPDSINKVAYATSFGVSSLPDKYAKKAKNFLSRLNHIMVREENGQKLVKQLIGKDVPVVADPTLLFTAEEWNTQLPSNRSISDKYVLCYFLGNNPQHRLFAKQLAKAKDLKIVQLPNLDEYIKSDEDFADYPLYDVNPLDFVALIRGADFVLTDSFHCTVFSNLFQKQFYTFRRYSDDGTASTNSRLYSLLNTLGHKDRMLKGTEDATALSDKLIDYTPVMERISTLREQSLALLEKSISN